ncbi:phosphoribosylformylglycinamidine synthase subunit PurS [soil metagenome]
MSQQEFVFGVTVMPRKEVLDTQGRAVEETLRREGEPVISCRVGRYVELKLKAASLKDAQALANKVSEGLLANALIETYKLEAINGG